MLSFRAGTAAPLVPQHSRRGSQVASPPPISHDDVRASILGSVADLKRPEFNIVTVARPADRAELPSNSIHLATRFLQLQGVDRLEASCSCDSAEHDVRALLRPLSMFSDVQQLLHEDAVAFIQALRQQLGRC